VFKGSVIDFVQKKLKSGFTPKPYIRSHDNGWVFCREGVELPSKVKEAAIEAVAALNLDFGAVDLAISKKGSVCVFEVNTAPGIEGTTVTNYAKAISAYLKQLKNATNPNGNTN
jgi:Fe-S cluster assembly iron-binding protein IscA